MSPVVALCLLTACALHRATPVARDPIPLAPGSETLRPPALNAGTEEVVVFTKRATGDTAERRAAVLAASERSINGDGTASLLTRTWSAPFSSIDSLVVDPRSLRPRDEVLFFGGATRRFHYEGSRVIGTVTPHDSSAQSYAHDFGEPIFAFNEVDALVRSLTYRQGLTVVVPLFSEVDRALERDTLTVVSRQSNTTGGDQWLVRFADPVITTQYLVDAASRLIVDARTTQRASGLQFHYVYSPRA